MKADINVRVLTEERTDQRMFIPFGKPNFCDDEIEALIRVMRSGWIGMGPETIAFEKELASFLKAPYVVTVNSCTSALFLSLLVLGIKPGDEVICPSLTWCSTANAILYTGATPVFCDIDPNTLCLTPESVAAKITDKTKAVIVVHMGGYAVDVNKLAKALPEHVAIVEDAAHALGAKYPDGTCVGSSGNLTCFSFYANKNLSTAEGGAISLFNEELYTRLCSLRQHGLNSDAWKRYINPQAALVPLISELGYKMNYTDLQACIGRVQLRRQQEFFKIRKEIASIYYEELQNTGVEFQRDCLAERHSRHLFTILLPIEKLSKSRDEFVIELRNRNIGVAIHYPPLHKMPLYSQYCKDDLINTDYVCERILTLPISASMSFKDARHVFTEFLRLFEQSLT